ncbi:hypothetical protein F4824DRAFT_351053 [Ustulina deusta]|nr:hypothetical protein F4824DRAFT_351053 [Ustulina deusta]
MGTGNRFKHQGVPEPLSEAHFARLKRKAGLPVDDVPETKKRKAQNGKVGSKANGKPKDAKVARPLPSRNGKVAKSKSKKGKPEPKLDLEDDFLGSDDSVYDSGGEGKRRAMFSEDEDDSDGDAEERLTAANIVGLSRKLDKERAQEEVAAEAELQETLQTNIGVPHVLKNTTGSAPRQQEEVVDKTPILADDKVLAQAAGDDDFGGFDDDEDAKYMQPAKRNAMRKRGLDPKALEKPKAGNKAKSDSSEAKTKAKPTNSSKAKSKRKA